MHKIRTLLPVLILVQFLSNNYILARIVVPRGLIPVVNSNKSRLCSLLVPWINGTSSPLSLLKGQIISIAVNPDTSPYLMTFDGTTKLPNGGLMFSLQKEIARRGGWGGIKYVLTPNFLSFPSSTAYLLAILPYVDFYGGGPRYASATSRSLGIGFTSKVDDNSMTLIGLVKKQAKPYNLWRFLEPLADTVWLTVVCVCIVYAIFHYLFEMLERRTIAAAAAAAGGDVAEEADGGGASINASWALVDGEEYELTMTNTLYQAFADLALTDSSMQPSVWSTKVLRVGYIGFLYVIIASYTAALAGSLITSVSSSSSVTSISDANAQGQLLCVEASNYEYISVLARSYPGVQVVKVNTPSGQGILQAMTEGVCVGGLVTRWEWNVLQNAQLVNPRCSFFRASGGIRSFSGSWAFDNDVGPVACTTLVGLSVTSALTDMKSDGTYGSILAAAKAAYADTSCPDTNDVALAAASTTSGLGLAELGGIFLVYAIFVGLSLLAIAVKAVVYTRLYGCRSTRTPSQDVPQRGVDGGTNVDDDEMVGIPGAVMPERYTYWVVG